MHHGANPTRAESGRQRRARTRARIIAAAFDSFGTEHGLHARIEDIAASAGVTRMTFYNHFSGMDELREAVTYELTHAFLTAVTEAISTLEDPRERAASAVRFYLHRVASDPDWGRSMLTLSASGVMFGAETYREAEQTVSEGMRAGYLSIGDSGLGRDLVLGTSLAAIASMLGRHPDPDYPTKVAEAILRGLGVPSAEAEQIASRSLPELPTVAT